MPELRGHPARKEARDRRGRRAIREPQARRGLRVVRVRKVPRVRKGRRETRAIPATLGLKGPRVHKARRDRRGPQGPPGSYAIGAGLALAGDTLSAEVTQTELDTGLAGKANASHTHALSDLSMATSRVLGRATAGAGAPEELSLSGGLALLSGALTVEDMIAPGDLTGISGGSFRYFSVPGWISSAAASVGADLLFFAPIYLPQRMTITRFAVQNRTAVAGNIRLGLYRPRTTNGLPGALVYDAGAVSLNAAGDLAVTGLNLSLDPGWYWGATNLSIAATSMVRTSGNLGFGMYFSNTTSVFQVIKGLSRPYIYANFASLPADESSVAASSYSSNDVPLLGLGVV